MKTQLDRIEAKLDLLMAKKKPVKPKTSAINYPVEFESAWSQYPKRLGSNPKRRALQAWFARGDESTFLPGDGKMAEASTRLAIEMGVQRYCEFCDATGKTGTEYVMQAATFFGPDKHYENDWTVPTQAETIPKSNDDIVEWAAQKGFRNPAPGESFSTYRRAVERLYQS